MIKILIIVSLFISITFNVMTIVERRVDKK
jgi:hypothetical protein